MTNTFDPITLEVLWNRLLSVVNEQQVTLMRTAFSTVVRESQDLACGVFDTRGSMIAQSLTGTPGHINAMATGVRHFLKAYPAETLQPGDVLITNDPWQTAGQINDMTILTPVFKNARVIGYFASTCHAPDIGGHIFSGEAREVYEEGLRIPITKLFIRDEPNHELFKIIRANVRTPNETIGDLYAQTSSNAVGARELIHFMLEFNLDSIDPLADEIIARSERAMRESIRTLPNGRYENESWSDGFDEPIRIKVAVTIEDEDLFIDFAGSSPQSSRGINVVLNYTHAYASFAIKAAISPEVPHNEGAFRPVHVTAPPGCILNCLEPAAVASRHLIGHFLPGVTYGPADGIVDPHRVTFTYLRLAKERGASVYVETPMTGATWTGNAWRVETPKGIFEAEYLINAAGSWAGEVARRARLEVAVPVYPVRRLVFMTTPTPWQHVYPLTIDLTSGFYLRSEGQRILFGRSNSDEPPGFTEEMDWDWFEPTIRVGLERFPWMEETRLDHRACWWGFYEVTPDHNPILGRMPTIENWINVTGFSGHGVQQAPAIGRLIAEEVVLGKAQSINIDPLRITRFTTGQQSHERNII